jgi:predicted neuraminidase
VRSNLLFGAVAVAVVLPFAFRTERAVSFEVPVAPADRPGEAPYLFEEDLPAHPDAPRVHAAALEFRRDGRPLAVWFGGSREGGKDVAVWFSVRGVDGWSRPRAILDRVSARTALRRHIRRIGNPLLARDADGHLWLHVVTTSAGGWSAAQLNSARSTDEGETWGPVRRHVTAPFVNLGTLLRAPALRYADGSVGLPAYHELFGRFGDLYVLDPAGRVAERRRMNWGRLLIQPAIVPLSATRAVGFFRQLHTPPGNIWRTETNDGGRTWTPVATTDLPNPNSGIAALALGGERLLMAYNDQEFRRNKLALALSNDAGRTWRRVRTVVDDPDETARYAYPALARRPDGRIQMLFTWNREAIRSMVFNVAWLEAGE